MKRIILLWVIVLFLAFSVAIVVLLKSPDPNAPQFRRLHSPAVVQQISYDFLGTRPFEGGKMWITTSSGGTNWEAYLFDIEKRQVFGRVTHGWPVLLFGDPPQLLCSQSAGARNQLQERLAKILERISLGRFRIQSPPSEVLRYWVLNLENNTASRIGDIPGTPNFSFVPSPDDHYAYTGRLNNRGGGVEIYCLDLKRRFIKKLGTPGWASGWWDNTHILIQTTNADFALYDVTTRTTSPLIRSVQVEALFRAEKLSYDATKARSFFMWNGRENDFYLTDSQQRWLADESFLIKVERPDATLKLLSPRFKFEWSDYFNPTGHYYLYGGRETGDASDGVFLRDLRDGTTNVLVAPMSGRYHSIPRFYRDSVIYVRSNALWRVNLDGSKNVRLFPLPETAEQ